MRVRKILLMVKIGILFILIFAALLFSIKAGLISYNQNPGKTTVIISENVTANEVAYLLKKKEVIKNSSVFSYYLSYTGNAEKIVSGEYIFNKNMDIRSVAKILGKGPVIKSRWITIPEGFTIQRIAEKIDRQGQLSGEEFVSSLSVLSNFDYGFLPKNDGSQTLEGYLFPETYRVWSNSSTKDFIEMMLRQFGKVYSELDWSIGKQKNLSAHQLLTIASLIERESKVPAERPVIASVIYNRLERDMPLQIDATVQYALPRWKKKLFIRDLQVDSPYNTYKHKGLPPGPICNPGKASIEAALKPANTNYLYYVLMDEQGNHAFSSTYDEFLRNKRAAKTRNGN